MNHSPIILLHGYPFDRSMWREQIDFLNPEGYQVVAPDLLAMYDKLQFVAKGRPRVDGEKIDELKFVVHRSGG